MYRQAEGKPYREELNKAICKLNENPWTLGDLVINLELLKSAQDILTKVIVVQKKNGSQLTYNLSMHKYCQLFQALLQNNHLSAAVFEELVEVNLRDGVERFVEV